MMPVGRISLSSLIFLIFIFHFQTGQAKEPKRCLGTNSAFSISQDRMNHLSKLINRYTNCTIVQGNLEITGLEQPDIDASFLKDIEVVTGYVLIAINYIDYIPLENLKIIRGQELHNGNLALHVAVNYNRERPSVGLRHLGFKSLTEIQKGSVSIVQNNRMCYADTINWEDIMNPTARKRGDWKVTINNTVLSSVACEPCHPSCNGHCWGPGEDQCQILTSSICHENCGDSRCRGPGPDECCDRECACGCTGPTDKDCIACLHMNNSGVCQSSCPPRYNYDSQTQRYVVNPDFKYHFNEMCVDKCPSNMLMEDNGCVKHCRKGYHNDGSGVCVKCNGNECNKECFGVGNPDGPLSHNETVDAKNVHFFEGCNIVRGNVIFQAYAFSGDDHTNTPPMTAEQIRRAFSGVKVINGYLKILSWPKELKDFSVFSELTTIMGIDLFREVVSLLIQDSITDEGPFHLSQIKSLGFRSLKSVNYGNVYIGYMKKLCYQDLIDWRKIIKNPVEHRSFEDGLLLRANAADCRNATCHAACDDSGCWGPSAKECLACRNLTHDGLCVTECVQSLGIYRSGSQCLACDVECRDTCSGGGPNMCFACKNFKDNGICVSICPLDKYGDPETKECLPCNKTCIGQRDDNSETGYPMCSGPNGTLAPGGCEYCFTVKTDRDLMVQECLPRAQTNCPKAHYAYENANLQGTERVCVPCIEGCQNCTGSSEKDCLHALPVKSDTAIIMAVVVTIVALGLICLIVFLFHHRKQKIRRERQKSMRQLGLEGGVPEPMTPSGVAPNQAQLRIVKETELRVGKILGSGAFGTVHNGYWIPDLAPREKVRVPVAIKVLREESSQVASNEILDEAFVMASCEHPNLVRLLGISLSQKIMLITQLMPLGNLLEYVRDHKDSIGSQIMLNWCLQIAKGMCYLADEKHLVHRDLAARNVLVKSPNHVRITDFGLAKLLDVNEDVYRAEGGKMPIKWLALESIQHRLFTQKSDVWSFGVTVWELLTFGKKPYENVPAREVHTLLEKGERLLQPGTCTIDVYMLMIKCWTVDPESRPTFRELVEDFSKMARDPQRYLVIANDNTLPALPSPTNSEFFRGLKHGEDDDFPLQDAEEYLHPSLDSFEQPSSNGRHFSLQPAPLTAQWRKQVSEDPRNPGRFGSSITSSNADSRLDSAVTVMTSLPSESTYPNGCSTPHGVNTPGSSMTPRSMRNGFPAFGRSNSRISHDQIPGTSGLNSRHPPGIGPRTQSESSDVFISAHPGQHKDNSHLLNYQTQIPEHPGIVRAREDSAASRYCAEPILSRQESRPNDDSLGRGSAGIQEDEDGYLEPDDNTSKREPEYLEPIQYPNASPYFPRGNNRKNPFTRQLSKGMENPEYEPTFIPARNGFSAGSHNLIGRQASIPIKDDDGYEVPMAGTHRLEQTERRLSTEYENINLETGLPDVSQELEEDEHGYLAVNHRMLPRRRDSHGEGSTSSEKRDSGLQSEGDEEAPLRSKNVNVAGDVAGNDFTGYHVTSESSASDYDTANHNVDNPNYELLENMTDGGFRPTSTSKPQHDDPWGFDTLPPFPTSVSPSCSHRNPLQLTVDCNGCDDVEDNIFVTPETKRREAVNIGNLIGEEEHDDFFTTPEAKRRGKLTSEFVDLVTKTVPRTYSEPDSGVGIEVGMDNMLYHRLGSSGGEGSE